MILFLLFYLNIHCCYDIQCWTLDVKWSAQLPGLVLKDTSVSSVMIVIRTINVIVHRFDHNTTLYIYEKSHLILLSPHGAHGEMISVSMLWLQCLMSLFICFPAVRLLSLFSVFFVIITVDVLTAAPRHVSLIPIHPFLYFSFFLQLLYNYCSFFTSSERLLKFWSTPGNEENWFKSGEVY